jgi:hypothetical protein
MPARWLKGGHHQNVLAGWLKGGHANTCHASTKHNDWLTISLAALQTSTATPSSAWPLKNVTT